MENNRAKLVESKTRAEKEEDRTNKSQKKFEAGMTIGMTESERELVLDFFSSEPVLDTKTIDKIRQTIDEIEDVDARKELGSLYARILGVEAEILTAKNNAVGELSVDTNIPSHDLLDALPALVAGDSAVLENDFIIRQREGNAQLEMFVKECKQPYNLFYLDKDLGPDQLKERANLLDSLYRTFKSLSPVDKNKTEEVLNKMFDIPTITTDIQSYLEDMEKKSRNDKSGNYVFSEGAENKNFIYQSQELQSQVIKISKGRHDIDFTSIIKLMRDMHYLALHFDKNQPPENNVRIHATFDDMVIYRDDNNNYKRLIRQEFAAGVTIKELPREIIHNDPGFRKAWKVFLRHIEKMKDEFGVVLDITDSAAGFKKERGNVTNTGNVFVKLPTEPTGVYEFSIIDPDVFDVEDGEHKFDHTEHLRKKGFAGILDSAIVFGTNQSRERIVRKWQDQFITKELE